MEGKYTKGPWRVNGRYIETETEVICELFDSGFGRDVRDANALLISAAPDLLEALRELSALMQGVIHESYEPDVFTLENSRAAIAKATGQANG